MRTTKAVFRQLFNRRGQSSQSDGGAATTRRVAKEMLQKKMTPRDKSQQMIHNNYQTIQYIVDHKDASLSTDLLLQIHRLMTNNTMANPEDAGRFRSNDDVVVENGITHETVHTPPSYKEIPQFIDDLCAFFNDKNPQQFIHPVIRGIVIHFMIHLFTLSLMAMAERQGRCSFGIC